MSKNKPLINNGFTTHMIHIWPYNVIRQNRTNFHILCRPSYSPCRDALIDLLKPKVCFLKIRFLVYVTPHCVRRRVTAYSWSQSQCFFFQKNFFFFLDTLILKIYFLIIKINNFRGDLSGISARTATLYTWL